MTTKVVSRPKRVLWRYLLLIGVLSIGLAVASAVFAAWTTISFTNDAIDGTWGAASYTDASNSGSITDRNEIKNAWVRYDGTFLYFRIDTYAGPALSGSNMRAVAGIDCNHNGTFNDSTINGPDGDRLIIYDPNSPSGSTVHVYGYDSAGALKALGGVPDSPSDAPQTGPTNISIEWGVPLYLLYPACRASTSAISVGWSIATGGGAVSDQTASVTDVLNPMDYGDTAQTLPPPPTPCAAPDTATGLQCNGARHGILPPTPGGSPLRFGSEAVDADPGNLQNAASDADDLSGTTPDDEQGIYPDSTDSWTDGSGTVRFTIVGASSARLGCWVDFNKNGIWTDSGETLFSNVQVGSGTTSRGVTVTANLVAGNSYPARCRIWHVTGANTPTPVPAPNGAVEFGEVEDHIWSFDAGGFYVAPGAPSAVTGLTIATSGASDVRLTWNNPTPNDRARVLGHATNPYFTSANGPFAVEFIVTGAPWEYVHTGVRGAPANTVYYIVYGRVGSTDAAAPSNRTGLFEFDLTPGQQ